MQEKTNYLKVKHALKVQSVQLEEEIALLNKSIILAQKSRSNQKRLLKIAKVSLSSKTITQEEYLRYEDNLANAKTTFYKAQAQKWQDIARLGVIYGNDLRRIVK